MAKILLGVTGSIAAYKACELVRLFVRAGDEVVPLVTSRADRLVRRQTFLALARRSPEESPYPHLERGDLLVIAPLTANTLAKLAHGLASDILSEAFLAHRGPVLVAPAMSPRMWEHPATQTNVALVRERGVEVIGPEEGEVAEGGTGWGRMSEPEDIFARACVLLGRGGPLAGRQVLVTAGGTREPIDAVRFVGNRSSGRMGVALAEEARRRGARVTLLAANVAVPAPFGVEVIETPTAAAMAREALARAEGMDVVLMAAAVADYAPAEALPGKRAKDGEPWQLRLVPTLDILRTLGERRRDGQVLVGFAADCGEEGLARARAKLREKRADLIVFNDVSQPGIGFEAGENEVVLVCASGERRVARAPKERIAASVLDTVEELLP
ncbi:MAG: bifunctional phosphopantothenoylcysteine decarboxylase/phosphopantothenate--cysteine ligase CoaBC [Thermoleophilia bacterium]